MQNRMYNARAVVEAGLTAALLVVIMLAGAYIPGLDAIGSFILPVPVTVLYMRQNLNVTLGSVVVSGILAAILYNPISALASSIIFGTAGIALGYCIRNNKKFSTSMIILSVASGIGMVASFSIQVFIIYKNGIVGFINDLTKSFTQSLEMTKAMYSKMGMTPEQLAMLDTFSKMFNTDFILKLLPAILIMGAVASAYLNYIITKSILKKLRYEVKEIPQFRNIYINSTVGLVVVAGLFLGILMKSRNLPGSDYVLNSSQSLFQLIFVLNGWAVASYFLLNRFNWSKPLAVIVILFTAFTQLGMIYFFIGLADMLIDFRKINPNRIFRR